MGENQIGNDLYAERVRLLDQKVDVGQGPENGINVAIVSNVIAEVLHGRGEEGADPDGVDAEGGNVFQVPGDAGQVPDAVAVRVGKAARIDLIDHRPPPPFGDAGFGLREFENLGGHAGLSDTQTR